MKNIFRPELYLSIGLLVVAAALPSLLSIVVPEYSWITGDLFFWYAVCLTLSVCIAAIKLTFNRLIVLNPEAKADNVFELEEERMGAIALLKAHAKSAELILLGIILLSFAKHSGPVDAPSLLLFISSRVGTVMFLLGGIVILSTHSKMRKL